MENRAIKFFKEKDLQDRIFTMKDSTASAIQAAEAIGVDLKSIAKSLTFRTNDRPIMIVMSGDAKIDSKKFRQTFKVKSKMLDEEDVVALTGYKVGGVCPFNLATDEIDVYLDESLKRSQDIYPGCGDVFSLVKVNLHELEIYSDYKGWIDIGKDYE